MNKALAEPMNLSVRKSSPRQRARILLTCDRLADLGAGTVVAVKPNPQHAAPVIQLIDRFGRLTRQARLEARQPVSLARQRTRRVC